MMEVTSRTMCSDQGHVKDQFSRDRHPGLVEPSNGADSLSEAVDKIGFLRDRARAARLPPAVLPRTGTQLPRTTPLVLPPDHA
jgi:hypothetical protein